MTWLNPAGWWWLLAAAPVVALYILRIRRKREVVSTLQFWKEAVPDSRPRAWWQQLRNLASLLVQLLFLLLVVFALADPLTVGQKDEQKLWILLIDRSASMAMSTAPVSEEAPRRIDLARVEALDLVKGLREWDEAMVATFGNQVEVVCGRTDDMRSMRKAIAKIESGDIPGDIGAALGFAASIDAGTRKKEVVIWTDLPGINDSLYPSSTNIHWRIMGPPVDNAGLICLAARPAGERRDQLRILVGVANYSNTNRNCTITLRENNILVDAPFVELAAGEERYLQRQEELTDGSVLTATLLSDGPDALALDDKARLIIRIPEVLRVGLIADSTNIFLEEVLAAQPLVEVIKLTANAPELWVDVDILVFYQVVPDPLPNAAALFLEPESDCSLWTLEPSFANGWITSRNERSALMRHVHMHDMLIPRTRPLEPVGGDVLLRMMGRPVAASWEKHDQRVVVWTLNLRHSDIPFRVAFPVFVANSINWLAARNDYNGGGERTGSMVRLASSCTGPCKKQVFTRLPPFPKRGG